MSNIENSYHLNLLRKVNNLSKKYYESIDGRTTYEHDSYLAECNAALYDYFKKSLFDRFLFSALSYIKHTKYKAKVTIVKGDDEDTNYNFNDETTINGFQEFKEDLNEALQKVIHEKGVVSMTNILLDKKNTHDLYLVGSTKVYTAVSLNESDLPPNIIELPLGKIKYLENPIQFREDENNKILIKELFYQLKEQSNYPHYLDIMVSDYIWHYKKIANTYYKHNRKHLFIYFIRPSIIDDKYDYNLLLSLATNVALTETELTIIDLLVYKIVSQMFIEKIKDEEHQNLLTLRSGMGHFLKNRVRKKQIDVEAIEAENSFNNEIIKKSCNKLKATFTSLSNIGNFFYIISSITKNEGGSVFGTKLSRDKNWVQTTPIKLLDIFDDLSSTVYETTKAQPIEIKITDTKNILKDLEIHSYKINGTDVLPTSWIYKEILFELFYNAGKYSPSTNGIFEVKVNCGVDKKLILSNKLKVNAQNQLQIDRERYSDCLDKWGKIKNHTLSELSGLAFIEEFLEVSKIGELEAMISIKDHEFSIRLKLNGLTKIA